jgi:hypothetical protein
MPNLDALWVRHGVGDDIADALTPRTHHWKGEYMDIPAALVVTRIKLEMTG